MERDTPAEMVVSPYQHLDAACHPCVLSLAIVPLRTCPSWSAVLCDTPTPVQSRSLTPTLQGEQRSSAVRNSGLPSRHSPNWAAPPSILASLLTVLSVPLPFKVTLLPGPGRHLLLPQGLSFLLLFSSLPGPSTHIRDFVRVSLILQTEALFTLCSSSLLPSFFRFWKESSPVHDASPCLPLLFLNPLQPSFQTSLSGSNGLIPNPADSTSSSLYRNNLLADPPRALSVNQAQC